MSPSSPGNFTLVRSWLCAPLTDPLSTPVLNSQGGPGWGHPPFPEHQSSPRRFEILLLFFFLMDKSAIPARIHRNPALRKMCEFTHFSKFRGGDIAPPWNIEIILEGLRFYYYYFFNSQKCNPRPETQISRLQKNV